MKQVSYGGPTNIRSHQSPRIRRALILCISTFNIAGILCSSGLTRTISEFCQYRELCVLNEIFLYKNDWFIHYYNGMYKNKGDWFL